MPTGAWSTVIGRKITLVPGHSTCRMMSSLVTRSNRGHDAAVLGGLRNTAVIQLVTNIRGAAGYPYLLHKLAINRANQVWALDTTYIPMARGFVYLTAVVDAASRRVLAHRVAITLEAIHAKEVIEQAFARFVIPEIVNTDHGSQFTVEEFTSVVLDKGCKLSMDGRGAWRNNVFVKRLWRRVKYERVYLKTYDGVSAAHAC